MGLREGGESCQQRAPQGPRHGLRPATRGSSTFPRSPAPLLCVAAGWRGPAQRPVGSGLPPLLTLQPFAPAAGAASWARRSASGCQTTARWATSWRRCWACPSSAAACSTPTWRTCSRCLPRSSRSRCAHLDGTAEEGVGSGAHCGNSRVREGHPDPQRSPLARTHADPLTHLPSVCASWVFPYISGHS